jgi:Ca2+-binding RTX toxin-like protein
MFVRITGIHSTIGFSTEYFWGEGRIPVAASMPGGNSNVVDASIQDAEGSPQLQVRYAFENLPADPSLAYSSHINSIGAYIQSGGTFQQVAVLQFEITSGNDTRPPVSWSGFSDFINDPELWSHANSNLPAVLLARHDQITGGGGNDTISGYAGFDQISGGDGDDWIRGGEDDDILIGGSGNDTFIGTQWELGGDVIRDFGVGDRIVVEGMLFSTLNGEAVTDTLILPSAFVRLEGDLSAYVWASSYDSTARAVTLSLNSKPQLGGSPATVSWTEDALPLPLFSTVSVVDNDGNNIVGADIWIDGFTQGDVLTVGSPGPYEVRFDARGNVLSLAGVGTAAEMEAALRSITYAFAGDEPSADGAVHTRTISYSVMDEHWARSSTAYTQLPIAPSNDAPVHSVPGLQTVEWGTPLVFSGASGNRITISDPDVGGGMLNITLTAAQGLLTLSGTTGLSFVVGTGAGDTTVTFRGSLTDINNALNGMIFTPDAGYYGPASIQIETSDLGLSGAGGAQSDSDVIAITVSSREPAVTGVNVTNPDGRYKAGDTLFVTVGFDQAVTVNTGSGTPSLLLETGAIDRRAVYVSGSGTRDLTSVYTVQEGDVSADLDYHSTAALVLNGATIRNAAQDDAILTLPARGGAGSIAGQHAIVVENVGASSDPGWVVTPNAGGGMDIPITDPSQLTASLGTGGVDHVFYSGTGTVILPDNIENLTLTGGNAHAQGNALGNAMRGSTGDNALWGAAGNDWVHGGDSSDTVDGGSGRDYVFGGTGTDLIRGGAGNDTVNGGSGNDTVNGGSGDDRVYGDAGRDTVYGGKGSDTISGGAGNDILFGNAGRDVFVFDIRLNKSSNVDTIKDFNVANDCLWLDNSVFTQLGRGSPKGVELAADLFVSASEAQDAQDRIIYDLETGSLYYDRDGTGSAAQVKFVTLSNKAKLSFHDFFVI